MEKDTHPKPRQPESFHLGTLTGLSIVMANMIGTGAFTSLGFQVKTLFLSETLLTLWVLGGFIALSGALSYAEVGTHIRKSGGEYAFLSQLYHPLLGYLSGWISLTVGFTAPIALSAMALISYFPSAIPQPRLAAVFVIATITLVHTRDLKRSARFQDASTFLKIGLIFLLIGLGIFLPGVGVGPDPKGLTFAGELLSPAFAIALVFVVYAYSGWNAAAYISQEFRHPTRSLPIVLVGGTLIVTLLYVLLQWVFLKHLPLDEMEGQLHVATLAARRMLGDQAASLVGAGISLSLVSSVSAMVWVGARITSSMATGHAFLSWFQSKTGHVPVRALWLQGTISCLLILTGTFEQILVYCSILITLSSMLVVIGVFRLRSVGSKENAFRSPAFPFFQVLYLILTSWVVVFAFSEKPLESLAGLLNVALGIATYYGRKKAI